MNTKSGKVISEFHHRQFAVEFWKFLDTMEAAVPVRLDIDLMPDNSRSHKTPLIRRRLERRTP